MDSFHSLFSGLYQILPISPHGNIVFLYMLSGILIGFVVGIFPGIGGPTTISLMLPYTFTLDPSASFAFLLGMLTVTATTGDITSIIFGIPGEATATATIIDGYELTKHGETGRAISASLMSSLFGAWFGALILFISIPFLKPLLSLIGSPEILFLAILGITCVSTLSGDNLIKGLLSGCFGVGLSMIGLDSINGIPRFTFESVLGEKNSLFLWDGISIVTASIGLFAIPEIINMTSTINTYTDGNKKINGIRKGIKDVIDNWPLVLRSSAIGAYIGLIPGIGGATSQWIAHAHAIKDLPQSKGRIEGVIGPSAANNSKDGASLIPTIAIGVPGSLSMAILLGAFRIQGITPGPDLLDPEGNLALTFSFVGIIIISNIIAVALTFILINKLVKVVQIKKDIIIPFLTFLSFLGAYSVKNSHGDIILIILFGFIGYMMSTFNWSRASLLLGLVLGGVVENSLLISIEAYKFDFFIRPFSLISIFLILISIYRSLYIKKESIFKYAINNKSVFTITDPSEKTLFTIIFLFFLYILISSLIIVDHSIKSAILPLICSSISLIFIFVIFIKNIILVNDMYRGSKKQILFKIMPFILLAILLLCIKFTNFSFMTFLATFTYLILKKNNFLTSALTSLVTWLFFSKIIISLLNFPAP